MTHYPGLLSCSLLLGCLPVSLDPVITDSSSAATGDDASASAATAGSASESSSPTGTGPGGSGPETAAEAGTEAGTDTDSSPGDDTGECETACEPEAVAGRCVRGLAWSGGPIGLVSQSIADGQILLTR